MRGVNHVVLVGTLGQDPELNMTTSGKHVCNIRIATNEVWIDNNGKQNQHTEWHNITMWGKQALNADKYLRKGSRVYVSGKIRTRSWEDKETRKTLYAKDIISEEVQYLDRNDTQQGNYQE